MGDMPKEDKQNPQDSLGRWIWIIHRHCQIHLNKRLEKYGLGSGQFRFFHELAHFPGISQEHLSERLEVDKATTTRAIQKLIKLGYVRRSRDKEDKRAYKLYLSPLGQELVPVLKEELRGLTARLSTGFSGDEQEEIFAYLRRMAQNICNGQAGVSDD